MKQQTGIYSRCQVIGKLSFFHGAKKSTSLFYMMFSCVYLCNYEFGCESIFHCYILLLTTHISTYFPHFSIPCLPYTQHKKTILSYYMQKKLIPAISHRIFTMFLHAFFVKILFDQLF